MSLSRKFDLIISGNGAIGCSFALCLSKLLKDSPLNLLIIEKQKQNAKFPADFPSRNFALTNTNLRFLKKILASEDAEEFLSASNRYKGMQIWQENSNHTLQFGLEGYQHLGYFSDSEYKLI